MMGTLPLQPGAVRLMLIRDVDTGTIVDAEVFFSGDEAVTARSSLVVGLDGEFRDYRPDPASAPGPALTCEYCKSAPATHLLVADVCAKRVQALACQPCATTNLQHAERITKGSQSAWLFTLIPADPEADR